MGLCVKWDNKGNCIKSIGTRNLPGSTFAEQQLYYGNTKKTSAGVTSVTRNINDMPEWKGDPNDKVAIEAWKASYEPGYTPEIISPRDSSGKYTSDPSKTVSFITMDKEAHAKEIAIALQSEPKIPMNIVDYLTKTLSKVKEGTISTAPVATTLTKTKGEEKTTRTLTTISSNKFGAIVIAGLIVVLGLLHLNKTK